MSKDAAPNPGEGGPAATIAARQSLWADASRIGRIAAKAGGAMSEPRGIAPRSALNTIRVEVAGLTALYSALLNPELHEAFEEAIELIIGARGRVIVTGMGKSGIIARKVAATLSSTGTPSMFLHPAEASHGDLGMITPDDLILALSWSGETAELGDIITYCHRFAVPLIVMTSNPRSAAGRSANVCLALPAAQEACPNRLAPTTSTTVQLVMGDALAVALLEARGFSASDFHVFHPGGKLGSQLLTVRELMAEGDEVPIVRIDATMMDATIEMSRKRYGATAVIDAQDRLIGAFTDGDLRRSIATGSLSDPITLHMTTAPKRIESDAVASEALRVMNENSVMMLFVCDGDRLTGVVHLHDVLRAGVV